MSCTAAPLSEVSLLSVQGLLGVSFCTLIVECDEMGLWAAFQQKSH